MTAREFIKAGAVIPVLFAVLIKAIIFEKPPMDPWNCVKPIFLKIL